MCLILKGNSPDDLSRTQTPVAGYLDPMAFALTLPQGALQKHALSIKGKTPALKSNYPAAVRTVRSPTSPKIPFFPPTMFIPRILSFPILPHHWLLRGHSMLT